MLKLILEVVAFISMEHCIETTLRISKPVVVRVIRRRVVEVVEEQEQDPELVEKY